MTAIVQKFCSRGLTQPSDAAQQPSLPDIRCGDLWDQFWADVFGKEVQDATTYSYTWLADQVGHVCLGLIANFAATIIVKLVLGLSGLFAELIGMFVAIAGAVYWEWRAYQKSVGKATGLFPLGKQLLWDNAIIASVYMTLGAIAGFLSIRVALALAAHETPWWEFVGLFILVVVGLWRAPRWLRQKITWQKAALPYLARLAEAPKKALADNKDAELLQEFIMRKVPPPEGAGCQVIIIGQIGSGRTSFAAAIGTEFAFKPKPGNKVRYLSFDTLLELAVGSSPPKYINHSGPLNINYWPWSEAQVVVIDNIGPVVAAPPGSKRTSLEQFGDYLDRLTSVADVFHKCHSVWVIGDPNVSRDPSVSGDPSDPSKLKLKNDEIINSFSVKIKEYCHNEGPPLRAKEDPLIIEMFREDSQPESGQVVHRARIWRKGAPSTAEESTIQAVTKQRAQ